MAGKRGCAVSTASNVPGLRAAAIETDPRRDSGSVPKNLFQHAVERNEYAEVECVIEHRPRAARSRSRAASRRVVRFARKAGGC